MRGFTLIELLAVLIIIGLLSIITISSVTSLIKQREQKINDIKMMELKILVSDFIERNSDTYQFTEYYTYCIPINSFLEDTDYSRDKLDDLFKKDSDYYDVLKVRILSKDNMEFDLEYDSDCSMEPVSFSVANVSSIGEGISEYIENVVSIDDNYLLYGSTEWVDSEDNYFYNGYITLLDNKLNQKWKINYKYGDETFVYKALYYNDFVYAFVSSDNNFILLKIDMDGNIVKDNIVNVTSVNEITDAIVSNGYIYMAWNNNDYDNFIEIIDPINLDLQDEVTMENDSDSKFLEYNDEVYIFTNGDSNYSVDKFNSYAEFSNVLSFPSGALYVTDFDIVGNTIVLIGDGYFYYLNNLVNGIVTEKFTITGEEISVEYNNNQETNIAYIRGNNIINLHNKIYINDSKLNEKFSFDLPAETRQAYPFYDSRVWAYPDKNELAMLLYTDQDEYVFNQSFTYNGEVTGSEIKITEGDSHMDYTNFFKIADGEYIIVVSTPNLRGIFSDVENRGDYTTVIIKVERK